MTDKIPTRTAKWEWLALASLIIAGLVIRVWYAAHAPGFWYDEAINALDALDVLRKPGYWPIFFSTEGHMREPMYLYIQAVSLALTSPTAFHFRLTSAIIGTATIPAVWALSREFRGSRFAAVTTFLFVFMRWHIHFSGLGFRTILAPLFCALTLIFLLRTLRTQKLSDALLLGVVQGLGLYTYLAFRLVPVAASVCLLLSILTSAREFRKKIIRPAILAFSVTIIVFVPLGIDYMRHHDHFAGRSDEVTLFDQPNATELLVTQARDVLLSPLLRGDHVGKHNLPGPPRFLQFFDMDPKRVSDIWSMDRPRLGAPPLDPHGTGSPTFSFVGGVLFYLGMAIGVFRARRDIRCVFPVVFIVIGSAASILSYGAPNLLRLLFLSPIAAIAIAQGLAAVRNFFKSAIPSLGERGVIVIISALLVLHLVTEMRRVVQWHTHPMVTLEFNKEFADIGEFLARQKDRLPVRLPDKFINDDGLAPPTIRFIAERYTFNPTADQLGARWWEFRTVPPFPPLDVKGARVSGGRTQEIYHPAGILMGMLVEVEPATMP